MTAPAALGEGYGERMRAGLPGLAGWRDLPFFRSPGFDALCRALDAEPAPVLPEPARVFRALETPPDAVRVVILGQDPYPTPGHADGLAFSVAPGVALPRSLANIFRELQDDTGRLRRRGDLSDWAGQGVLLLNTQLTVRAGAANAHRRIGWQPLVAEVLDRLARLERVVWILWGRSAQTLHAPLPQPRSHLVLPSAHPSPLSAARGFFGSRPFGKANRWLAEGGRTPIEWTP